MKLVVQGMTCGHCVSSVTNAIQSLASDLNVRVDLASKEVQVDDNIDVEQVILAIKNAGFTEVSVKENKATEQAHSGCCSSNH